MHLIYSLLITDVLGADSLVWTLTSILKEFKSSHGVLAMGC